MLNIKVIPINSKSIAKNLTQMLNFEWQIGSSKELRFKPSNTPTTFNKGAARRASGIKDNITNSQILLKYYKRNSNILLKPFLNDFRGDKVVKSIVNLINSTNLPLGQQKAGKELIGTIKGYISKGKWGKNRAGRRRYLDTAQLHNSIDFIIKKGK